MPGDAVLLGAQTEAYQSPTLRAGRNAMPGRYPYIDRNLIILNLQDDRQVFMVGGRVDPSDRFDLESSLGGGIDPRKSDQLIYTYDGVENITEYMEDGSVETYTGDNGDPDLLVESIRQKLGILVAVEAIGQALPPGQMIEQSDS